MPFIVWTPFFSVSHPALDADHARLMEISNDFFEALAAGRGNESARECLQRLVAYADGHFAREEALLAQAHYPGLVRQRAEHERLLQEVFRIHEQWARGGVHDEAVLDFLRDWIGKHILDFDHDYAPYVAKLSQEGP
jgi:hemerythrin-like metal-binding protein